MLVPEVSAEVEGPLRWAVDVIGIGSVAIGGPLPPPAPMAS